MKLLVDVASWQGALKPADVHRAGFDIVNVKVSHGLTQKSVHPNVAGWVTSSRSLGMEVSSFHWLTGEASGESQAEYAWQRLAGLDLIYGCAHFVDVEDPTVTLPHVRGYITRMTELLGRTIGLYSGDWWWIPRRWNVSDLTPYLMAAPNEPVGGIYPGDASPAWLAGWGGWPELAVMQYAVAPLTFPDGTTGTVRVSKSAVRDPAAWSALTLGRPGMTYSPATLSAVRALFLETFPDMNPLSVGVVGDTEHDALGTSYHLGKDALKTTAYSIIESSRDKSGLTNASSAIDIGMFTSGKHNLRTFSVWLVGQCDKGAADTKDIREVIYSPDGKTVKRWDRLKVRSTGPLSHTTHTHISWFRDSEKRDKAGLFIRYFEETGIMPTIEDIRNAAKLGVYDALAQGARAAENKAPADTADDRFARSIAKFLRTIVGAPVDQTAVIAAVSSAIASASAGEVAQMQANVAELMVAVGGVDEQVLVALSNPSTPDEQVAAALESLLGDRKDAVLALIR